MRTTRSGIILRRRANHEHDLLLEMYVEHMGRVSVRARGALRRESKLRGHLEPGRLVRALFTGQYPRMSVGDVATIENFVSYDGSSWWYQGLFLAVCEAYIPWGSYSNDVDALLTEALRALRVATPSTYKEVLQKELLKFAYESGVGVPYHEGLTLKSLWHFLEYHAPRMMPSLSLLSHVDEKPVVTLQ